MSRSFPQFEENEEVEPVSPGSNAPVYQDLDKLGENVLKNVFSQQEDQTKQLLQANRYIVSADVYKNTQRIAQESASSDNPYDTFKSKMAGYTQGVLKNTPQGNQAYVQELLSERAQPILNKFLNQQHQKKISQLKNVFNTNFTEMSNSISNLAASGNQKASLTNYKEASQLLAHASKNGLITSHDYVAYNKNLKNAYYNSSLLNQYQNASDKEKFVNNFLNNKKFDSQYSYEQKLALVYKFKKLENQKQEAQGLNNQNISNIKKNILFQLQNGGQPNPHDIALVKEKDPSFENEMSNAQLYHGVVNRFEFSPLGEIQHLVNNLQAPPNKTDLQSDTARIDYINKQAIANKLQDVMKSFKNDPMQQTLEDPNYTSAVKHAKQTNQGNPNQIAINIQEQRGLQPSQVRLLSNGTAAEMVAQIHQLPFITNDNSPSQLKELDNIVKEYGRYSNIVLRDLHRAGWSDASQLLFQVANNPQTASETNSVANALQTNTKDIVNSLPNNVNSSDILQQVKNNLNNYSASLEGYNGPTQPILSNIYNQVNHLALYYTSQGMDFNKASQKAANVLVNDHYNYGNFHGYVYRAPKSLDSNQVNQAAQLLIQKSIKQGDNLVLPQNFHADISNKKIRRELYIQQEVKNAYVITMPDNSGIQLIDATGNPIKTIKGQKFIIPFNQIREPSVDLLNSIKNVPLNIDIPTLEGVKIGENLKNELLDEKK